MIYDAFRVTQLQGLPPRSESWTSAQMELPPRCCQRLQSFSDTVPTQSIKRSLAHAIFRVESTLLKYISYIYIYIDYRLYGVLDYNNHYH